ncbi:hypothetical protein [Ideonella sp.]|uniref:hypothetical protein n=1 Tax=Ideonella sp. TaxID=1929293 RepID=UPI0035B1BBBC
MFQPNRRQFTLALTATLAGCATTGSVQDGSTVGAGQGLLALQLSANRLGLLNFNPWGESSFGARFAENMVGAKGSLQFIDGDRYLVLPVDAGEYMWTKLTVGNQFAWLLNSTRFRVRPGVVTYIGHLRLSVDGSRFGLIVRDREQDMRDHLQQHFPTFSARMPFEKVLAEVRLNG